MQKEQFSYDNTIVRNFAIATMIWGIVGMLVGVIIATQLFTPELNFNLRYVTFGRIRPLHTNAVIFAFVGNAIFMGVYYSLQRLLKARMYSDVLSRIHFWGWQLIIVSAALTLPMGITTSKEYAELEWPIDIAITLIWVVFGWNMIGTIFKRRERHMYVAIWFYLATFLTVALLHVVNSFELPVSLFKSYSWYAGVQDALVQWWYGHNAVAFFLTTPFLGLMYYFMPKMAERPIYSYKLSILHFWSLIFIYIWAGPHHLLYSSLPDWAQTLGVAFSVMLIAPSWGGMLNGLLTLRGAWDKVRDDARLKFMVVGITAYGMATFEGPMLSLKNFNALAHFTDWIVSHVHVGALGWNGFLTFGILYYLIPKLYNTKLASTKLVSTHFWIATLGIIFYAIPMYISGATQGLMWKQFTEDGMLKYSNFLDTTLQILPMHMLRAFGGLLYLTGAIIMVVNLVRTMKQGKLIRNEEAEAYPLTKEVQEEAGSGYWHRWIERKPTQFLVLAFIAVLIGGAVEFLPTFLVESNIKTIESVTPYSPLELAGRDIYIREGCNNCHSQLVRPFRSETVRYGDYSKAGENVYDHPFLWGSKRTGPDLARSGSNGHFKKGADWHFQHMWDPRSTSTGSIMPRYMWLYEDDIDAASIPDKISAMRTLGVNYDEGFESKSVAALEKQASEIWNGLVKNNPDVAGEMLAEGVTVDQNKEIIALIAYLHKLGRDINTENSTAQVIK
ncbi:MAG: cytochrome-c oxidase, cbb3-type subunit I [Flavobacteriales bacterium]|nr:cytochrome-c oxidase, cbb3-type subunit I [Bacteroidota bacterium]MCB9240445.1 cytochrome-c oxidase, cbb3-type subunit I [Flavobacteriales bacterium]